MASQSDSPATRGARARLRFQPRALVIMAALAFLVLHAAGGMQALLAQTQIAQQPQTKIVLPTLPPSQRQIIADEYADSIMGSMSLTDKIAQMIMIKLYGPTLTTPEIQDLDYHIGGVIAFGDAVISGDQMKTLTRGLQQHAALPLLISTDQEGGRVNRLKSLVGDRAGEAAIGASNIPSQAQAAGAQTAEDFYTYGLNMNFAPVVDIADPGVDNPQLVGREYASDPHKVAQFADAYLQGFQQPGLVAVIKHFPGLGSSATDPHSGIPQITKSLADLEAHEFVPYKDLLALGHVQAIMVTHEMLLSIDTKYPATLSQKITTGLLRNDLGFNGVIITDSLTGMAAIVSQYTVDQASLLALEAGADILMGAVDPDQVKATIDTITNAVQSGMVTQDRIDASVHRILKLKIAMGLIPLPHTDTPTPSPTTLSITPSPVATRKHP